MHSSDLNLNAETDIYRYIQTLYQISALDFTPTTNWIKETKQQCLLYGIIINCFISKSRESWNWSSFKKNEARIRLALEMKASRPTGLNDCRLYIRKRSVFTMWEKAGLLAKTIFFSEIKGQSSCKKLKPSSTDYHTIAWVRPWRWCFFFGDVIP